MVSNIIFPKMKRLFFVFFIAFTISSCQKKMGGFQVTQRENLNSYSKPNQELDIPKIEELPFKVENLETSNETVLDLKTIAIPENHFSSAQTYTKTNRLNPVSFQTEPISFNKENKKIKKRIHRNPVFNDSLKMGFVLLFIAIGLSFLPVLQLTLLFGIVALIFLFIGLKKLFKRRIKEKNKRIRKENNQIRKEKVKDLFQK